MRTMLKLATLAAVVMGVAACGHTEGQRALTGGLIGAGAGGLIGGNATGAIVGGAVGAVGGAATTPHNNR
jgi:osmotically inducible lipoprotein OsmB